MIDLNRVTEIRRRAQGALNGDLNYDPPVGDVVELIKMIDALVEHREPSDADYAIAFCKALGVDKLVSSATNLFQSLEKTLGVARE